MARTPDSETHRSMAPPRKKASRAHARARRAATENAVLTADLLGAVADAIIDLHGEILVIQSAVAALQPKAAGSVGEGEGQGEGHLDEVVPLQILVQALQGIQAEITEERELSARVAAGIHDLAAAQRALQTEIAVVAARDDGTPGAKLDKIEGTLRTLTENASRLQTGEGEVAAAVVRLSEDASKLRAEVAAARAGTEAVAKSVADLAERVTELAQASGPQHQSSSAAPVVPWLVLAIAVLALTWGAALFFKTGDATIPLIGMAAANAACCAALLVWPRRR
jgi:methyl-accepting chemotaxis protein